MKAYNEYMNKISVSGTLHQRFMSCADKDRYIRSSIVFKRYAVVFACLTMVLLGVFTIPKLMQPIPGIPSRYILDFNRADGQIASSIYIPGHFWQELTANEVKAILPSLENTHSIKAMANFQSNENGVSLFNIDANVKSSSGYDAYIQIAPGEIVLDYVFDSETKSSDLHGTVVRAGYFETKPNSKGLKNVIYFATFSLWEVAYYVELRGPGADKEAIKHEITELIGLIIEGGVADLEVFNPVVPQLRDERLEFDEARADADFGEYIPLVLPQGFVFEDALRFINQEQNALFVTWTKGMGYINWRASLLNSNDRARITSIADRKNYDLALYPIPRADSVPEELREIVDNPIFLIDELALGVVQSRTYEIADVGDESDERMHFSVLYGDVLIELNVKGASAGAIFNILKEIENN